MRRVGGDERGGGAADDDDDDCVEHEHGPGDGPGEPAESLAPGLWLPAPASPAVGAAELPAHA